MNTIINEFLIRYHGWMMRRSTCNECTLKHMKLMLKRIKCRNQKQIERMERARGLS